MMQVNRPLSFTEIKRHLNHRDWLSCDLQSSAVAKGIFSKAIIWIKKCLFRQQKYHLAQVIDAVAKRVSALDLQACERSEKGSIEKVLRLLAFKVNRCHLRAVDKHALLQKLDQISLQAFQRPCELGECIAPGIIKPQSLQEAMSRLRASCIAERMPLIWSALTKTSDREEINRAFDHMSEKKKWVLCCSLLKEVHLPKLESRLTKLPDEDRKNWALVTGNTYLDNEYRPPHLNPSMGVQEGSRSFVSGYFSYLPDAEGCEVMITDFSNKLYGGGVLGDGFVQEEIMMLECPELLEALLQGGIHWLGKGSSPWRANLQTRRPLDDGSDTAEAQASGKGVPDPIFLQLIRRHVVVDGIYGQQINQASMLNVVEAIFPSEGSEPFNVLAMAAPKLEVQSEHRAAILALPHATERERQLKEAYLKNPLLYLQIHRTTVLDFMATALAGLELCFKENKQRQFVWRTGKLGCGAFNNHPIVAYLTQRYAAAWWGIDKVEFYDYRESEKRAAEVLWQQFEADYKAFGEKPPTLGKISELFSKLLEKWLIPPISDSKS